MRFTRALIPLVRNAPPHVAKKLADQGQSKALAMRLARYERLENMIAQRRIDPWATVGHGYLDRQPGRLAEAYRIENEPADEPGTYANLRLCHSGTRVAGIRDQIDQDLLQRALIGSDGWQRGIEFFFQFACRGARCPDRSHRIADGGVEIAGPRDLYGLCAQLLHAVDELRNPIHFCRNHLRQRLVLARNPPRQQLACPADRGKRVLDFMGQHCRSTQFDAFGFVFVVFRLPGIGQGKDPPSVLTRHWRTADIHPAIADRSGDGRTARHDLRIVGL